MIDSRLMQTEALCRYWLWEDACWPRGKGWLPLCTVHTPAVSLSQQSAWWEEGGKEAASSLLFHSYISTPYFLTSAVCDPRHSLAVTSLTSCIKTIKLQLLVNKVMKAVWSNGGEAWVTKLSCQRQSHDSVIKSPPISTTSLLNAQKVLK